MAQKKYDIIIIGGGTAGLTAAIYARRAGKTVLLLEGEVFGGQIAYSPKVENFPGLPSVSGTDFADRLVGQVQELGADIEFESVTGITDGDVKTVTTESGSYEATALIAAVGLTHRKMGIDREDALIGHGISYCAVCDGAFFKGKDVAVYGGGNTALQDALFLTELCRTVTIIHRRDQFRGDQTLADRLKKRPNAVFCLGNVVTELHGDPMLTGVTVQNTKTGALTELSISGLFVAVGQLPRTAVLNGLLALDPGGFVIAGEDCRTERAGIFAAGDCRTKDVRQLTTAAADGAVAATAACAYVNEKL